MRIEEEHPDVLQNIEFLVALHYGDHPDTTDYNVARVYDALIDVYAAETVGRQPRAWNPSEEEQALFEGIKDICDWWLGRKPELFRDDDSGEPAPPPREIELDTLRQCLKRLSKSVQKWTKRGGRQGYLMFMSKFMR